MLGFLPAPVLGVISFFLLMINTIAWCVPLVAVTILKLIVPLRPWRKLCGRVLDVIATSWIRVNNFNIALTRRMKWDVTGVDLLKNDDWYLVLANHQSWVDILVLQKVFSGKIPFLKFFLKKELIYVPLLGIAWWALDFPFMKRYSKAFLKKNPQLKGRDIEITKRACAKFRHIPVSIMNFVEGTRFNPQKSLKQKSPYNNLLLPKAGGIAYVLEAMGSMLHKVVDVTIHYPRGVTGLWGFLCGRVPVVKVSVEVLPVTDDIIGDYAGDHAFRESFQTWLREMWERKDRLIDTYRLASEVN